MFMSQLNISRVVLGFAFVGVVGCGPSGPQLHPVVGKVVPADQEVADLAGCSIEIVDTANDANRGFALIQPDGQFVVESLQAGEVKQGVLDGVYKARIILNDEDQASRKRAANAVATRYQKFETSGLEISVPSSGEVVLPVLRR